MLQKSDCLGLDKLVDHVAEDGPNGVEPFIGMANIGETGLVQQNLLYNEDSNSFRQL